MKEIPLTRGRIAIVDDEDFEWLSKRKWHVLIQGRKGELCYAESGQWINGRSVCVKMHRLILGAPKGVMVDHINGNGLDNRRCNLRLCTPLENARNVKAIGGTSQFKGVNLCRKSGKWKVKIRIEGKLCYLGLFTDEVDAARTYDRSAAQYFGEFAKLNFPNDAHLEAKRKEWEEK